MTETGQNFEMYQEEIKYLRVPVYDEDGNLLDMSTFDIVWRMYHPTTKSVVTTKTKGAGIVLESYNGVTNSRMIITIEPEDTATALGRYNHECKIFDVLDNPSEVFAGTVVVVNSEI